MKAHQHDERPRERLTGWTALERSRKVQLVAFYLRAHDRFAKASRTKTRRPTRTR
jgi:hypothetical protein